MCGICGIVNRKELVEQEQMIKMLSFLHERGPDNEGVYIQDHIGIGHTRLSIIDLSPDANQPMFNDNKSIIISFNGEIYNFHLIRTKLEKTGIKLTTNSDTEVILKAYEQWGIELTLDQLDGMFAIAIYDKRKDQLYLARDRFGKKPVYYYFTDSTFSFSSNIKSIWANHKNSLTIDWESVDYYLTELSVPQPKSIWKEIRQIKPAHYAVLEINDFKFSERRYWNLPKTPRQSLDHNETQIEVTRLLTKAISKRQISDVPLGFFLSGGIDSGLITAIASQNSSNPIKTLTVSLDDTTYDESSEAELIANKYSTDHNTIHISSDISDTIDDLIEYMGEPFADSSLIPSFLITKVASEDMTVMISGDGGDEIFGGYDDYHLAFRAEVFAKNITSKFLRNPVIVLDKALSRISKRENLGSLEHYSQLAGDERLLRKMSFLPSDKDELYLNSELKTASKFTADYLGTIWQRNLDSNQVRTLLKSSLETRLLNDYLVKIDRASMRNSIEIRCPFLDKDLAEFAFATNTDMMFSKTAGKKILRNLAESYLGESSASRAKTGFRIPLHTWLRTDLKSWRNDLILSFANRNILNHKFINDIIYEFDKMYDGHTNKIWAIICLELWFQKFID
jgi:asparagine synthase (glutamine-hydrolysing)